MIVTLSHGPKQCACFWTCATFPTHVRDARALQIADIVPVCTLGECSWLHAGCVSRVATRIFGAAAMSPVSGVLRWLASPLMCRCCCSCIGPAQHAVARGCPRACRRFVLACERRQRNHNLTELPSYISRSLGRSLTCCARQRLCLPYAAAEPLAHSHAVAVQPWSCRECWTGCA